MSADLQPGAIFAERYRIERRIASGGMGDVYEVVHIETNRRRALKVLHANLVQSDELRDRFRREARVAAEIESEHIVDVFDAGIDAATEMPFLVMELLRGEDVRQRLKRAGPIAPDETVRILFESALALDKTHQKRIVHRDLKPDNLYLCEREHGLPRVKVLDFGIAKIVADGAMAGQTKESLGTPLYMAPEQFMMAANISPATDVFAMGLIAFTMLVGKPYWLEETLKAGAAVAFALHACKGPQESAVKRAAFYGVQLPPAFDEWFFKVTSPKTENRYQVATAAIADLAQVLGVALQLDAPPVSVSGTGSIGRIPLNSGVNVANTNPGVRPPMASIPGTTSSQPVLTPIGSGLTNTSTPPRSKPPILAIVAGAVGTLLVGGIVAYQLLSSSSPSVTTRAEPATTPPAASASPSASVAEPAVEPSQFETEAGASASATAATTKPATTSKAAPTTSSTTKQATAPSSTSTTAVRPTGTATSKKPPGGGIWNND